MADEAVDEVDGRRRAADAPDRLSMVVLRDLLAHLVNRLGHLVRVEAEAADERRGGRRPEEQAVPVREHTRHPAARVDLPEDGGILREATQLVPHDSSLGVGDELDDVPDPLEADALEHAP